MVVRDWRGVVVDSRNPGYWRQVKPESPSWPEDDPVPEVLSTDPRPADAPAEPRPVLAIVKAATQAGWLARVGYSRGPARAVRVGTYKMVETFGIWASAHPDTGWRFYAMYERTVGKTWSWDRVGIWKPGQIVAPGLGVRFTDATVSDLKDFILVRGSVLPSWFKGVHARVQDQRERQRAAARARPASRKPKEGMS